MVRIAIDCPTDFIKYKDDLLYDWGLQESIYPEILITNPGSEYKYDEHHFNDEHYQDLKIVATPSTGNTHIDLDYLEKKGIEFYSLLDDRESLDKITASSEFTWLHIMNAMRKFRVATNNTRYWREKKNEDKLRTQQLSGKTIGIIGYGRIGKNVSKYAEAFGMDFLFYDPDVFANGNKVSSIDAMKDADIISINCGLNDTSRNLITYDIFKDFKKGLVVVNTSRGEVVDERYISLLIKSREIFYSADVIVDEQNLSTPHHSELYKLYESGEYDNLTLTPHVAGVTTDSQQIAFRSIIELCMKSL
jgi:D-3-phosphoglycerate dehydrogenase|tara:strand:+ start:77 stop:991 length:915 start_codon:yes stop_codon:yes gene_type:complete